MRKLLFSFVFVFTTSLSFSQIINDNTDYFNYAYDKDLIKRNKVASITSESVFSDGTKMMTSIYYFDTAGILTKQQTFDKTGKAIGEILFEANKQKDLIGRIENSHPNNKSDTVSFFKNYEKGRLIKDSTTGITFSHVFKYDERGNLVKTISGWSFGAAYRVIENKYDSSRRISSISEKVFQDLRDTVGVPKSNRELVYDKNGKLIKEIEKINGHELAMINPGTITYAYYEDGNLKEIRRVDAASRFYKYNEKGLVSTKKTVMNFSDEPPMEWSDNYTYTYRK